ncbi:hypothetical protein KI387_009287, partial [Taxus chinensis]
WKLEGDRRIEETMENQKIGQGQNQRTRLYVGIVESLGMQRGTVGCFGIRRNKKKKTRRQMWQW